MVEKQSETVDGGEMALRQAESVWFGSASVQSIDSSVLDEVLITPRLANTFKSNLNAAGIFAKTTIIISDQDTDDDDDTNDMTDLTIKAEFKKAMEARQPGNKTPCTTTDIVDIFDKHFHSLIATINDLQTAVKVSEQNQLARLYNSQIKSVNSRYMNIKNAENAVSQYFPATPLALVTMKPYHLTKLLSFYQIPRTGTHWDMECRFKTFIGDFTVQIDFGYGYENDA